MNEEEELEEERRIEEEKDSDTDSVSSDPRLCRQSPPTQIQSLSEESSGCSTRRRAPILSPSSTESLHELVNSPDPFGEGEMEDGEALGEATNHYVKLPVPKPRTSLLRTLSRKEDDEEDGCDSDSTLDPQP